jgi:serine protease inhibitor
MKNQDNFDQDSYQYDIERRIMERDFTKQPNLTQKKSNFGEITGHNISDLEFNNGMPLRPQTTIYTSRYKNDKFNSYSHTDFNLYDTESKINVSYFDEANIEFADINNNNNNNINNNLIINSTNIFSFNFNKLFAQAAMKNNFSVLSPISVIESLSIIYIGSKNKTEEYLGTFLGLPSRKLTFDIFNQINNNFNNLPFYKKTNLVLVNNNIVLNNAFVKYISKIGQIINFDPSNLDINKINKLTNTSNLIQPNILLNTSINIISSSYFICNFKSGFDSKLTKLGLFNGIQQKNVPMMIKYNSNNKYFEDDNYQILEMDHMDDRFGIGFILPKYNYGDININNDQFQHYIKNLADSKMKTIMIPKFVHKNNYKIEGVLGKSGLITNNLDLSDIVMPFNKSNLNISNIIHSMEIDVGEGNFVNNGNIKGVINFVANHQFLYYVRFRVLNLVLVVGSYY